MKKLDRFFSPRSIAIVGASPKKEKLGNILLRNILDGGWKGKIYLINLKYKKIGAKKCHQNLAEIRNPVDLVLIAVPAPLVNQIIKDGAAAKPRMENYVIISSGFKESGKEGKKIEEDLKKLASELKLNILGPNCLGFINSQENLNATFTSGKFKKGRVAIVSQSGALAVALLDWTEDLSVGFSKVISIGNKTILDESDLIEYLSRDKETEAVALYLEDIKDGVKFFQSAGKSGFKKPLIVLKAGKTSAGQKAISSHTGSLAQDEDVIAAVFEKLNIIETKTSGEFQNLILFLNSENVPAKNEVIILTNAGGPGVLASDVVGKSKNIGLLQISSQVKNQIKKFLPPSASVENPIDIIGDATPDRYENTLKILAKKYPGNPLFLILTPQSQTDPEKVARIVKKFRNKFSILVTSFMGGVKVKKAVRELQTGYIANFETPEKALTTMEKLVCFSQKREKISFSPPENIRLKIKTNSIIRSVMQQKRNMLLWNEARQFFGSYGIDLTRSETFANFKEVAGKKIKFPCVLKTDDPKIVHRWDKKAVMLNIQNERELKSAYDKIKKTTGSRNFFIQPMVKPGLEMIIGVKRDKNFGPVIVAGWGGTFAEIWKDRIILIPPLTAQEVKSKLKNLHIFPVLDGFRREKAYDTDEIAKIVLALQNISIENPDISEIDINPVMLYNDGSRYQIPDAKIYLEQSKI